MSLSRRGFLGLVGTAAIFGVSHGLFGKNSLVLFPDTVKPILEPVDQRIEAITEYLNSNNAVAALKELYPDYRDFIYKDNPFLKWSQSIPNVVFGQYHALPIVQV